MRGADLGEGEGVRIVATAGRQRHVVDLDDEIAVLPGGVGRGCDVGADAGGACGAVGLWGPRDAGPERVAGQLRKGQVTGPGDGRCVGRPAGGAAGGVGVGHARPLPVHMEDKPLARAAKVEADGHVLALDLRQPDVKVLDTAGNEEMHANKNKARRTVAGLVIFCTRICCRGTFVSQPPVKFMGNTSKKAVE